jgi:cation:H+ antiporter
MIFLTLAAGLILLAAGAEILIRGAVALALAARISPLVVGLTVVAFGTSAPELVVNLQSAWAGEADLAMGNVIGSNIFNILLILGLAAMIRPLVVSEQLVRFDVPLMIGLSLLVWVMALDGRLGRVDGCLLTLTLVVYTVWVVRKSRREQAELRREYVEEIGDTAKAPTSPIGYFVQFAQVAIGLAMLVFGARLLIDAAVDVARDFGISELMIGITLVAAGTSLPEVATSVIATVRGHRDIAVGNAVGSNLFNIMTVLGLTALVSPSGIAVAPAALWIDMPVMIVVAIACLPVFLTGRLIARWEGAIFLGYFIAYMVYLVLVAAESSALRTFVFAMLGLVAPATAIVLALSVKRELQAGS